MPERMVRANGIDVYTETFGDPSDPPILLIMGAGGQGLLWADGFCERLAAGGRFCIRYDHRDTGHSTCVDYAERPYTLADLARDAVGVLDAYGIERAHVVGASMGGIIGQILAIEHPRRISSLTSIMSTPGGTNAPQITGGGDPAATLPPPKPELLAELRAIERKAPRTREERIERRLQLFRLTSGSLAPFAEELMREMLTREHDRARDFAARKNHHFAVAAEGDRTAALGGLSLPVLVIHGTEDPVCPIEHGLATANAIPGASFLTIEKMGHELPPAVWPRIAGAIHEHTAEAADAAPIS